MVLGPLHTAVGRSTKQIERAVPIPVDNERIAVMAHNSQRLLAALDHFGFGPKLALALSLEPVERTREVAYDQIEMTIAIPIDRKGPGADFFGHLVIVICGNDERLTVGALQGFRLAERPIGLAVQDLKQPGHAPVHARIRAGEDVATPITVNVHQLWSGAGASPHSWHFGFFPFRLQPGAQRELFRALVLEDSDLSLVELS